MFANLGKIWASILNSRIRQCNITKFYSIIGQALAITAFFVAIQYFTASPELEVSIRNNEAGYFADSIKRFYQYNNIKVPKNLLQYNPLSGIFTDSVDSVKNIYDFDGMSERDIIINTPQISNWDSYLKWRIEKLENHLKNHRFKRRAWVLGDNRSFYPIDKTNKAVIDVKNRLSIREYHEFLSAVIQSREVINSISMKNSGAMDLNNFRLIVYPPLDRISENSSKNILGFQVASSIIHKAIMEKGRLVIEAPALRIGQSLSVRVITKENKIESDELFYSYNAHSVIRIGRSLIMFVVLLLVMSAMGIYFNGKKSNE